MAAAVVPVMDPIEQFAAWWKQHNAGVPPVPMQDGLTFIEGVYGIVLLRHAPWQVQLFVCAPNTEIPDHTHPNVDSVEVYVGGEVMFRLRGERIVSQQQASATGPEGRPAAWGSAVRVRPHDPHGATIGPHGGAFLSLQLWLHGVPPTSVERDWGGVVMGPRHASSIMSGPAVRSLSDLAG